MDLEFFSSMGAASGDGKRVNPPSTAPILIGVSGALVGLMWTLGAARLYVKWRILRRWSADDVTCCIGAILATGYFVVTIFGTKECQVGKHLSDVSIFTLLIRSCVIDAYFAAILVPPTLMIIKVTFFIFYYRLFHPFRDLRIVNSIGAVITVLGYIGFFIAFIIFTTPPPNETWVQHALTPKMLQSIKLVTPLPAFGLAVDLYILAIPIVGVARLQLPFKKQLGVAFIFVTGICAVVASTLSIYYRRTVNGLGFDITYNLMAVYLTTNIEMTLGVCITCMPSLNLFRRHLIPVLRSLRSGATASSPSKSISDTHREEQPGENSGKMTLVEHPSPTYDPCSPTRSPYSPTHNPHFPMHSPRSLIYSHYSPVYNPHKDSAV